MKKNAFLRFGQSRRNDRFEDGLDGRVAMVRSYADGLSKEASSRLYNRCKLLQLSAWEKGERGFKRQEGDRRLNRIKMVWGMNYYSQG